MGKVSRFVAFSFILALAGALTGSAGDPDILSDFMVPPSLDPGTITRQYFTFTGFRKLLKADLSGRTNALVSKSTMKEFPALQGQGVSVSLLIYPPSGMNLPHVHPRAAELLILLQGSLEVGFVDSANKLYTETLKPLELFVFPKGLVHFQVNTHSNVTVALGMFASASAGTVSLPTGIFESGICADILAKAFKTDAETISKLIEANRGNK